MDRDPRSGTVLKKPLDLPTAKMVSTRKSTFKVTLSQLLMMLILNQLHTQMDSLLHLKSVLPVKPNLTLDQSGGLTEMARALKNGTLLKRLPVSAQPKKSSTRR